MSAYKEGFGGGYDFDTTSGNVRPAGGGDDIMYDENGSGAPRQRAPRQRQNIPQRQAYAAPREPESPHWREYTDDDVLEDDFDDYRPGERLAPDANLTGSYASFRRARAADDVFDDDFGAPAPGRRPALEDDFEDEMYGTPTAQRRAEGGRMGYSQYDGDYTDDDYASEFAGIRGISAPRHLPDREPAPAPQSRRGQGGGRSSGGPQRRPGGQQQRRNAPQQRPAYEDDDGYERYEDVYNDGYDDFDGYYGHTTMRDRPYEGNGVPRIFAEYFHDDGYDDYDEYNRRKRPKPIKQKLPVSRVRQNTRASAVQYRRKKGMGAAIVALAAALVLGAGVFYIAQRPHQLLNVSTALTAMESSVSDTLLKSSVDMQLASKTVPVEVNGFTTVMSLADCEFEFSTEADGTEKSEWGKTVTGSDIEYTYMTRGSVKFNETKVKDFLHQAAGVDGIRMIDPHYKVDIRQDMETKVYTGSLTITAGTNGYGIDFDTFMTELLQRIESNNFTTISAELTNTIAPEVDINKIYESVHATAADAYKVTDGSGQVSYEKEVIGVDFDKGSAAEKIAAGGGEWVINLALTIPEVTRKALMAETFPDLLATYTTTFNAGNQARSSNLALAGDYINGTVLQPQEVFSYNKIVGERTKERGFCKATVYSSEGTDEDYGGGICQTSSTLFYCAMKANLELVKRVNHMYTVSYMVDENGKQCFGNDATVNWGTADMQFRNNKEYPIKLECISKPGSITFNIWGTWDGYTAEYRYVEKAVERYKLIYRKYKEGKKNQAGELGRTIWTYRVIFYQEDPNVGEKTEVKRYREFESVYRPLSQVKYVTSPPAGCEFDVQY